MNIQIVKNKYLNALFLLMLLSAIIHMAILFFLAIKTADIYVLNYLNILDVDLFLPNILNSVFGNIFSLFVMVLIYLAILKINKINN
jgi:uncharacterized membrane protein